MLALQRVSGNRAVAELAQRHRGAAGSRATLQRAVGYEFETGWLVRRSGTGAPLKKKDRIGPRRGGFKLEADEALGGESEVEFIVDPPVAETEAGYEELVKTMTQVTLLGLHMQDAGRAGKFRLSAATQQAVDTLFDIYPTSDRELAAGPQVTSGLDLAKIGDLAYKPSKQMQALTGSTHARVPKELERSVGTLAGHANDIKPMSDALPELSPSLRGLLAVVVTYLDVGTLKLPEEHRDAYNLWGVALAYPKQIGDRLLARTDFGTLFELLPKEEQALLRQQPELWVDLVLGNLPDPKWPLEVGDSVIGTGVKVSETDPSLGVVVPDLRIGEWLPAILEGVDRIPTRIPGAESMGEFGSRTEPVGASAPEPSGRRAGIFEFRGAQTTKIPLERWAPFAFEFHRYVRQLHAR